MGTNVCQLIDTFWKQALLVCCAEGSFGRAFKAWHGDTQGNPLSPRLFNILVDEVIQEWLQDLFGEEN